MPGVLETIVESLKNPVTGAEHRARIDLPAGKEFRLAEVGSGTTKATGLVPLEFANSHAHFSDSTIVPAELLSKISAGIPQARDVSMKGGPFPFGNSGLPKSFPAITCPLREKKTILEAAFKRDRVVVATGLTLITVLAWGYTIYLAN